MTLLKRADVGWAVAVVGLVAMTGLSKAQTQAGAPSGGPYPKPRFPASIGQPKTLDDLMPFARAVARNKANILGLGLGVLNAGETVVLVDTAISDDQCVEAVKRALEERKVKVTLLHDYDLIGVSRPDAAALRKASVTGTTEDGYLEAASWIRGFGEGKGADWLKARRPDLFQKVFPVTVDMLPPNVRAARAKFLGTNGPSAGSTTYLPVIDAIKAYLTKHPEVRGVFYGKSGPIWMSFHPMEDKWLGTFMADDRYGLVNETSNYPADVWMLSEELTMEPLGYADKVHVVDPEGTDVSWDLSLEQAQKWAKGVYLRGHLFMFPNEAYGEYALSVVDYPALQKEWIDPKPIVLLNGVIGSTQSHNGFIPHITETWRNGYLVEVKGGGIYGEVLREYLHNYPKINDTTWPYYDKPGYFWHYETALGTNPKVVRDTTDVYGRLLPERMREGVIHWALGSVVWNDPETPGRANKVYDWAAKTGLPGEHGYHLHSYFNTYKVHLRNTEKWVTLVDRGRVSSLENPEVRALASRYGDATDVLATLWIPEVAGINAPGKYEDYAANPYKHSRAVIDKVLSGKYEFFYTPGKGTKSED